MTFTRVEFPGMEKASIRVSSQWQISYHRLFHISCEEADRFKGQPVTPWDVCFVEDLLQIENTAKGLLLDVGWFPDADPSGSFRLRVIPMLPGEERAARYVWNDPVVDYRTRSVDDLLTEIHKIVSH